MTKRIESLDTLKGFALLCVVYIHSMPFFSSKMLPEMISYFFANLSRIGVPAFFLVSGFLTARKLKEDDIEFVGKQLKRIGKVYVGASLLYLPLVLSISYVNRFTGFNVVSGWLNYEVLSLKSFLNALYIGKGVAPFLWFLPALFFSLAAVSFFYRRNRTVELLVTSYLLHLAAIFSNVYLLFEWLPIPWEDAAFFGLFFTTAGFFIGEKDLEKLGSKRTFLQLSIILAALHFGERVLITYIVPRWEAYWWNPYYWGTYSLLTAPMVICIFLYFLQRPGLGEDSRLNLYGKYTLLGYILHPAMMGLLVGLSILISETVKITLLGTLAGNLVFFPLAYVLTMEAVVWYRNRG